MGRKKNTRLVAVPFQPRKARIFLSRLNLQCTVDQIKEHVHEIIGTDSVVERIQNKSSLYASFLITVDKDHEDKILDPDEWQEGLIVRPFRGALRRPQQEYSQHDLQRVSQPDAAARQEQATGGLGGAQGETVVHVEGEEVQSI